MEKKSTAKLKIEKENDAKDKNNSDLTVKFFSVLVKQPSCIVKGCCDDCGRCEH